MNILQSLCRMIMIGVSAAAIVNAMPLARPNILFILSDDHSYPFLSCYGDPNVRTPAIDRLAAEGMKFHRFFVAAPQCSPSRAALLTGRSPVATRTSRFASPLPRDEITFLELLRNEAGYYTGICGRNYHLDGKTRGEGAEVGSKDSKLTRLMEKNRMRTFQQRVDYLRIGKDAEALRQMKEFLEQRPAGKPFALWLNFSDPHFPWNAPESFRPAPATLKLPPQWPDVPGMREQLADYCAEVNRVDQSTGLVLEQLAARGLANDTLVVFAGDNGLAFPHGKCSLYDPGVNVPLVIRWPGVVPPGSESRTLLSGEDIAPTLLSAAGLPADPRMSGHDFCALLKGVAYAPRQHVFFERGPHGSEPVTVDIRHSTYDLARAVRSDRHKFIYNCTPWIPYSPVDSATLGGWRGMVAAHEQGHLTPELERAYFTAPRPVCELYDLEADPSELHNLSGVPALREIEHELRTALAEKMIVDYDHLPLPDIGDPPKKAKDRTRRIEMPLAPARQ